MSRRSKPYSLYEEKERRRRRASAKYKREYGAFTDVFVKLVVYIFFGVFIALWYIIKAIFSSITHSPQSKDSKPIFRREKTIYDLSKHQKIFSFFVGFLIFSYFVYSFGLLFSQEPDNSWIASAVFVGVLFGGLAGAFSGMILYFFNLVVRKEPESESEKISIPTVSDSVESFTTKIIEKPTPEEAIEEIDRMNAKIFMDEFQDSLSIMQKTDSPETFFLRYDLLMERLNNMIELQQKGIKFTENLSELKKLSLDQENIADTVNVLIDNAYIKQLQKLSTLKTERGRTNSNQRWYASFEPYFDKMPSRSKTYLDLKLEALKEV